MMLVRIGGVAVGTAIPRVLRAIAPIVDQLDIWELFSPFGLSELSRALSGQGIKARGGGFHYVALPIQPRSLEDPGVETVAMLDAQMTPRSELFDKQWFDAFAVIREGQQASLSRIRWKTRDFIEIAVETHEAYRGRGLGTAVVAAATEWIHSRGCAAHYPVLPSNLPSVRIARRLGFTVAWQEIYA